MDLFIIIHVMAFWIDLVIDFLYPRRCVECNKWGVFLCEKCFEKLDLAEQKCPVCGEESYSGWSHEGCKNSLGMDGLVMIYEYKDEVVKEAIDEIKFGFNRKMVKEMLRNFVFESGMKFDMVVPLPLHRYRENWRGFNQAEVIALVIAEGMNLSVEKVLVRKRNTKQQSLIADKKKRLKNVEGAFGIDENWTGKLKGKRVLLIDDVFTSGSSMKECTKELKKAEVEFVWGLTLAG